MNRWSKNGVLDRVFEALQAEGIITVNVYLVCLDSTTVKVHPNACGSLKKDENKQSEVHAADFFGLRVEISKKLKRHGWQVLPKRWILERTFAWLNHSRRFSKDYELTVDSAETLIKISHIHTLLNRL